MATLTENADYIKSLPTKLTYRAKLRDGDATIDIQRPTFSDLNMDIARLTLLHGCELINVY